MKKNRKEEIVLATLELASEVGLKAVSMQMIADKIGIKKASLYNHFASKDEIIAEMYEFIREKAKKTISPLQIEKLKNLDAKTILFDAVHGYIQMCSYPPIIKLYQVLYSEQVFNPSATKIIVEETHKMMEATQQLFQILKDRNELFFYDVKQDAISFALTIHGLMDLSMNENFISFHKIQCDLKRIDEFILSFLKEHIVERSGSK